MKGVDAVGPMLEPQVTEGKQATNTPATTKDGKKFDAVLAEVVDKEGKKSPGALKGEARAVDKKTALELSNTEPATPSALKGQQDPVTTGAKLDALETSEEVDEAKLAEPKTPEQDQLVLAQIATVVARIVAPPQEVKTVELPKPAVAKTSEVAASAKTLVTQEPANDVAPPVNQQEFHDALGSFDLIPHSDNAVTVRPGASESTPPAATDVPRGGPVGRVLQALTGDTAPMRAAAEKVMGAFRALGNRDQVPTTPAPAPAPAEMMKAPTVVAGGDAKAVEGLAAKPSIQVSGAALAPPAPEVAPNPLAGTPLAATAATRVSPDMPTLRPTAEPAVQPAVAGPISAAQTTRPTITTGTPQQPVTATPTPGQPALAQPTQGQPTPLPAQAQPPQGQTPQAAPTHAQPPQDQLTPQPQGQRPQGQPPQGQPPQGQQPQGQPPQSQPTRAAPNRAQTTQTPAQPPVQEPPAQQSAPPQDVPPQPAAPQQVGQTAQNLMVPQPANGNAPQPPVVVQVQAQPVVDENGTPIAKEDAVGEARERVHGFTRGGWNGPAMSAYGGRGHEGGERGSSERGETARAWKREEERSAERASDQSAPQFMPEPSAPTQDLQQQAQAPLPPQEMRQQTVLQNQPAAPAAPVQELPDIVFQGRPPDPTAATENASIALHHPDLGPIQLEVHRELGRVEVHAVIETQHAQAVLRANESGIRQGVQQAGMTFNALRVRLRGEEQPSNNRPGQERRRRDERES